MHDHSRDIPLARARVSLRDIADAVGVTHATVSMALRNKPRISEETRDRIKEAADAMGYRPDPMLAALAGYRMMKPGGRAPSVIGWVRGGKKGSEDRYRQGVAVEAADLGYRLDDFRLSSPSSLRDLERALRKGSLQGLVLQNTVEPRALEGFSWNRYPVVTLGWSAHDAARHRVAGNPMQAALLAVSKLREAGLSRVGFVSPCDAPGGHLYLSGFLAAQQSLPECERLSPFLIQASRRGKHAAALDRWLDEQQPDAVFTTCSSRTEWRARNGRHIPKSLVAAFARVGSGTRECGIDPHDEEVGRNALRILRSMILGGDTNSRGVARSTLVDGSWVDTRVA